MSSSTPPPEAKRGRWRGLLRRLVLALGVLLVFSTAFPLGWLSVRQPVASAFMVRARFADPATGLACPQVEYAWVDWDAIPSDLRRAVVLAEDQRFLQHHGFDFDAIQRAVAEREGGMRGASTLTQQLAKNLFLWPGRSWLRKGLEAWYASWIELVMPKRRILELYLNVAQFGPCVFGVEAAAQRYFERPASELTREQSARLAAVLPNPARIRAWNPGPYARQRTQEILALLESKPNAPWLRGL